MRNETQQTNRIYINAIAKHSQWAIAFSVPPIPSQGKNLNMGTGDREALPTGDRSPLGTFHVRFPFDKTLTVNVFRQRINQLFQGGGDIWRGIAKHSLRDLAFSVPPDSFSREIFEPILGNGS
ncbi:hypothetical protein [Cylindrospermopsis raciborskii]|uniref:hypothetical protein n=1 Tax=Cylindrospermopsis raciborskii TaxID=77022 RepID=UPI002155BA03|nr:hypothetical protein [Cylindrospermopsis raciborskii]